MSNRRSTTRSLNVGAQHTPMLVPGDIILAIDPGLTTGIAQIEYLGDHKIDLRSANEIPWESRFTLGAYLEGKIDYVVMERFQLYESKAAAMIADQFPSVWISGIVEFMLWQRNIDMNLYLQPASVMASVAIEESHRWMLGNSEHRKDAYKHARYFCITNANRAAVMVAKQRAKEVIK